MARGRKAKNDLVKDVTLNIRIPQTLKQHGCEVLKREGAGISDVVRGLFEYMEKNQKLPEYLMDYAGASRVKEKREALFDVVGCKKAGNSSVDSVEEYEEYLVERYAR